MMEITCRVISNNPRTIPTIIPIVKHGAPTTKRGAMARVTISESMVILL